MIKIIPNHFMSEVASFKKNLLYKAKPPIADP